MTEMQTEDSCSVHSDDSNELNVAALKEKLENLINQESKHSHNYYDLITKDNYTRLDLENLNNSCQRYEDQKKKKSELLEEFYDRLTVCQRKNQVQLKERLSSIMKNLEEINSRFSAAYDNYNSNVLRNAIKYLDQERNKSVKSLMEKTKKLNNLQQRGKISETLMKPVAKRTSTIEIAINILIESSMKRPEIEMEETITKLSNEIKNLEKSRHNLKSEITNHF